MLVKRFKNKKNLLIIISICATIIIILKTYCATTITLKSVMYNNKKYSFYPECIRYHVKANGYEKKLKDEVDNNFYTYAYPGPGRELQPTNAKMQGYGNYVFKEDTSLFDFINYCYLKEPQKTTESCDWTILSSYSGKKLNSNTMSIVNDFWSNMLSKLGESFKNYQDLYFFEKYINKGACLVYTPNRLSNNGSEFITCMMSYLFSTNQNSAPSFEVKKGDIVPFLYIKDSGKIKENGENKYNISDSIKNDPKEVAKYAYLACINGWTDATFNDLWLEEYELILGEYKEEELCDNIDMSIEELAVLYYEIDELYQNEKGNKGNALLGATIDTIIQSDYSISQQLEATDWYLQNIEGIGNYKENMARNELMARYMMENSHIGDTIKDYNVGITFITENLQRGTSESKNTNTIVLSDFQVLEFEHKLNKDGHSDVDGISDLVELTGKVNGNIETDNIKWVDVTVPLRKSYVSKHGNEEGFDAELVRLFKDNGGSLDKNNNKVKIGHFDFNNGRGYYRTTDYVSNPILMDTDFDGVQDTIDVKPTDGKFTGKSQPIGNVEYVNDFRYFFIDNNKYNDELAVMSLIMSNLADGKKAPLHSGTDSIEQYMMNVGFSSPLRKRTFRISETQNIDGYLYLGKKTIQYRQYAGDNDYVGYNGYKDVYGVFLGGFDSEYNYRKLLSNFNKDEIASYYKYIVEDIMSFINTNKPATRYEYCYWVSGYSIAGGIASEVAARLKEDSEIYCYTFGATNTNNNGSGAYAEIKNIINEDDLYPKIFNNDNGFTRNGAKYNDSIFDNLQSEYRKLAGNLNGYQVSPKLTNTVKKKIDEVRNTVTLLEWKDIWNAKLAKYLKDYTKITDIFANMFHPFQTQVSTELKNILNSKNKEIEKAHEMKAYYVLAKTLNGFDLNNEDVGWSETEEIITSDDEQGDRYDLIDVIKEVGKWYVDNVYTYQAGRYGAEVADNITGAITYYSDEQTYQNEFKKRFRESWKDASHVAKYKRKEYMMDKKGVLENKVDLIMQDFIVVNSVLDGTFNDLNVDVLKQNERYTTNGRSELLLNGRQPSLFGYYYNDLVKGKVQDDCSSFISAVIYLFVNNNKEIPANKKYTSMPHYTSYSLRTNESVKTELESKGFKCYEGINLNEKTLQLGDILVREGHVEIYLDEDWSFGWGQVHNSYENNPHSKSFKWHFGSDDEVEGSTKPEGYYFYNSNQNSEKHYTRLYRYEGQ